MSSNNEEIIVTEGVAPVETVEPIVVAPVLTEKRYEWQPTDEDGRPIGGKQVIIYRTQDELNFKFQEQNNQLIRKLRAETRKNRLGIFEADAIDENAPRIVERKHATALTGEERAKLHADLLDPETFDAAVLKIQSLNGSTENDELRNEVEALKAQREVDRFKYRNPEYIACTENQQAVTGWMLRYNLAPVAENFQKAYDTLLAAGVLVTSLEVIPPSTYEPFVDGPTIEPTIEVVREDIPVDNQTVETVVIAPVVEPIVEAVVEPVKPVVSRVPTSLNRNNSVDNAPRIETSDDIVYEFVQKDAAGRQIGEKRVFRGQKAIDAMPADEYKRRLTGEKGFAAKVNKLNARK